MAGRGGLLATIVGATAAALIAGGCSEPVPYVAAFRPGDGTPLERQFPLGPQSEPASRGDVPGTQAAWAAEGAYLAVITHGSGSCPSGPHAIAVVGAQEIEVRLGDLFPDRSVCSADLSAHATVVDVPDGISTDQPLTVHFPNGTVTVPAVPPRS